MNAELNPWEQRYRHGDAHWDKGAPAPGLVDFLAAHAGPDRGSVLVPGCGYGHDVRAWARARYRSVGYDIAPSAIRGCEALSPTGEPTAEYRVGDFLNDEPFVRFDWIFEHTFFCAIQPAERLVYADAVTRWLCPGGNYLAVNYVNPEHPDGPPFPVSRDELLRRFTPEFDLVSEWVPRSYPNRTGRELMLWWRKKA
jgi:SAM-dependent methyltransferase